MKKSTKVKKNEMLEKRMEKILDNILTEPKGVLTLYQE